MGKVGRYEVEVARKTKPSNNLLIDSLQANQSEALDVFLLSGGVAPPIGDPGSHSGFGVRAATPVAPLPRPRPDNTCPVEPEKRCHRPKVVAFGADWCMWCRAGQPKLDALEKRGVDVEHINIDEHADLANQNNVTSIPVYLVIRCGHETVRTQDIDEVVRLMDEVMGR